MNKRVLYSLGLIVMALLLTTTSVAAFFSASVSISNNTFATGNLALRLFYDCRTPDNTGDVIEQGYGPTNDFVIVECPIDGNGSDERQQVATDTEALKYGTDDGATYNSPGAGDIYNLEAIANRWGTGNGWWGGLSSAMDHTMIYPGWSRRTNPDGYEQSDLISVGNSGTIPLNLYLSMNYETFGFDEIREPLDGLLSMPQGGDRVDPYTDAQWNLTKTYNPALAHHIELKVERVNNAGNVVDAATMTGSLGNLMNQTIQMGRLEPNEVAYVRFNWRWLEGEADNELQNTFFDYSVKFDATSIGAPTPEATALPTPPVVPVGTATESAAPAAQSAP